MLRAVNKTATFLSVQFTAIPEEVDGAPATATHHIARVKVSQPSDFLYYHLPINIQIRSPP